MRPLKLRHMRPPRPPCLSNRVSLLGCVLYDIYVPLLGFAQLLSGACKLVVLGVVPQVVALSPSLRYDGMFAMFLLPSDDSRLTGPSLPRRGRTLCRSASGFFEVRASSRRGSGKEKNQNQEAAHPPARPSPVTHHSNHTICIFWSSTGRSRWHYLRKNVF
jgi:hypothetical protein